MTARKSLEAQGWKFTPWNGRESDYRSALLFQEKMNQGKIVVVDDGFMHQPKQWKNVIPWLALIGGIILTVELLMKPDHDH